MNEFWVRAFVVTPLVVIALGWSIVLLDEWRDRRRRNHPTPGE